MTAAITAAVVVGGAAIYAGSQADKTTSSNTNKAISAQQTAQQQQQALNAPYAAIGTGTPGGASGGGTTGAITQYQNLLGLGPQGAAGEQATLAGTPGYQFAKSEGLGAATNAATASGMSLSGNTLRGLDAYSTGLADSTYQQAVGNAQNAVTIGQNAAAGTGSGILQTGANIGSDLVNEGNTLAGIDANTIAGVTKAASSGLNNYTTQRTLAGLNNPGNSWSGTPFSGPGGQLTEDPGPGVPLMGGG